MPTVTTAPPTTVTSVSCSSTSVENTQTPPARTPVLKIIIVFVFAIFASISVIANILLTQDVHLVWPHLKPFQVGTKTPNATMIAVVADEDVSTKVVMYPDAKNILGSAVSPSEPFIASSKIMASKHYDTAFKYFGNYSFNSLAFDIEARESLVIHKLVNMSKRIAYVPGMHSMDHCFTEMSNYSFILNFTGSAGGLGLRCSDISGSKNSGSEHDAMLELSFVLESKHGVTCGSSKTHLLGPLGPAQSKICTNILTPNNDRRACFHFNANNDAMSHVKTNPYLFIACQYGGTKVNDVVESKFVRCTAAVLSFGQIIGSKDSATDCLSEIPGIARIDTCVASGGGCHAFKEAVGVVSYAVGSIAEAASVVVDSALPAVQKKSTFIPGDFIPGDGKVLTMKNESIVLEVLKNEKITKFKMSPNEEKIFENYLSNSSTLHCNRFCFEEKPVLSSMAIIDNINSTMSSISDEWKRIDEHVMNIRFLISVQAVIKIKILIALLIKLVLAGLVVGNGQRAVLFLTKRFQIMVSHSSGVTHRSRSLYLLITFMLFGSCFGSFDVKIKSLNIYGSDMVEMVKSDSRRHLGVELHPLVVKRVNCHACPPSYPVALEYTTNKWFCYRTKAKNYACSYTGTLPTPTAVLRVIVDSSLIKISQPNKYLRPSFLFTAPCIIP